MIVKADTVVDPRAVMVHSSDAAFANGTVMAEGRLNGIAFLAVLRDNFLKVFQSRVVQDDFTIGISSDFCTFFAANASKPVNHLAHRFKTCSTLSQLFLSF